MLRKSADGREFCRLTGNVVARGHLIVAVEVVPIKRTAFYTHRFYENKVFRL